jgi:hypothetical protein
VSAEAPYGWTRGRRRQLAADPVEQIVIIRIRELRTAGLSDRQVARRLNEEGVRTRGTRLRPGAVRSVLEASDGPARSSYGDRQNGGES